MAIEKYLAITSMALFGMFVGEIASMFTFLINPQGNTALQLLTQFDTSAKILQFISIGSSPALILVGVSYILSRRYGSKEIGMFIILGGCVLLIGMAYCYTLIEKIDQQYVTLSVEFLPPIFMLVSIPVIIIGASLLKIKTRLPRKDLL